MAGTPPALVVFKVVSNKSTKFSISDNGGKVLVKCFAGCPQDEVIHDLKVRGLWPDTAPIQKRAHIKQMIERDGERAKLALFVYQENIARGYQMNEVETCKYLELKWRAGL